MPDTVEANVTAGTPNPHLLADLVASGRALGADVFDSYLYNALRFIVSSLAPFIERVEADGYPHLVRRADPGAAGGSLCLPIPGSLFAIELIAERGLEDAPRVAAWDVCSVV